MAPIILAISSTILLTELEISSTLIILIFSGLNIFSNSGLKLDGNIIIIMELGLKVSRNIQKYTRIFLRPPMIRRLGLFRIPINNLDAHSAHNSYLKLGGIFAHYILAPRISRDNSAQPNRELFPWWAILPLAFNTICYYTWIKRAMLEGIGAAKTLVKYLSHMIFYMNFTMPLATIRAFYQEIFKDIYWRRQSMLEEGLMDNSREAKQINTHAFRT